jgi:hypothetical protein
MEQRIELRKLQRLVSVGTDGEGIDAKGSRGSLVPIDTTYSTCL